MTLPSILPVALLNRSAVDPGWCFDETRLETEEMSWALGWINLNFTGLPADLAVST